jgi:hypothetical protein
MKVKFEEPLFRPMSVTFETKGELETFLLGSNWLRDRMDDTSVKMLFTSINRAIGVTRGDQ